MNINFSFLNKEQETFFWSRYRNNEYDGAFQNGKSYVGCMRATTHLFTFRKYAMAIGRQKYKALRQTTMKTFFKICPDKAILRHDEQNGLTVLINGSFIYWMHLDSYDEQDLRGLEINSALLDQAEELVEPIYNVLDSRIGRWDQAEVPDHLLVSQLSGDDFDVYAKLMRDEKDLKKVQAFLYQHTTWPKHPTKNNFLVPNYMDVLCNVANDEEMHWTYRYYHPDSVERKPDHFYIHREMDTNMGDARSYQQMLLRDEEWVDKYVKGKRGTSGAGIHRLHELSIIDPAHYEKTEEDKEIFQDFITLLRERAALYRIMDYADTGVTACLWLAMFQGMHIFYREYYVERRLISYNRKMITELSFNEDYVDNFADPSIFKKHQQSVSGVKAGFWTIAEEWSDPDIEAPILDWSPADNNEFATRNRINELLKPDLRFSHPISKVSPAPGLYFIKRHPQLYPHGVQEAFSQVKSQRRKLLGSDNGKNIYSEERDTNIVDHAYDCVRYGVAMHNGNKVERRKAPNKNSFAYFNAMLKRRPHRVSMSQD